MTDKTPSNVKPLFAGMKTEGDKPEVNTDVVETMKQLLKEAEEGDLQSIVFVAGYDSEMKISHRTVGFPTNPFLMHSTLSVVHQNFQDLFVYPFIYPDMFQEEDM